MQNGVVMKFAAFLLAVFAAGAQAHMLTLEPPPQTDASTASTISVGADTLSRYRNGLKINPELPAPPGLTLSLANHERSTALLKLPDFIDAARYNHAEFSSSVVRLMAPGRIAPFASLASEDGRNPSEDAKLGAGAGAKINISPNANFGTELLVFPNSPTNIGADALKSTKVMTRLELKF